MKVTHGGLKGRKTKAKKENDEIRLITFKKSRSNFFATIAKH